MKRSKVPFKKTASYYAGDEFSGADYDKRQVHFFTVGRHRVKLVFRPKSEDRGQVFQAIDPYPDGTYQAIPREDCKPTRWRKVFEGTVAATEAEFKRKYGHSKKCVGRERP